MEKGYWLVIIDWHGEVSYGVDEASYLARIFENQKEAEEFTKSDAGKQLLNELEEDCSPYNSGRCEFTILQFKNGDEPPFLGGGAYLE